MSAQTKQILSLFHQPGGCFLVVACQIGRSDLEKEMFPLTRSDIVRLGIGLQFLVRLLQFSFRSTDIELDDFLGRAFARIDDIEGNADFIPVCFCFDVFVCEYRIGEAVAERIDDIESPGIEIAVSDIDVFDIVFLVWIVIVEREGRRSRIILILQCIGIRQSAAR